MFMQIILLLRRFEFFNLPGLPNSIAGSPSLIISLITGKASRIYTSEEQAAMEQALNTFFTIHVHSNIPISDREEGVW
jgi:hypothetical protein